LEGAHQHLFEKEFYDAVVDAIDWFRFEFIEPCRRDMEDVEESTAMINMSNTSRRFVVDFVTTVLKLPPVVEIDFY